MFAYRALLDMFHNHRDAFADTLPPGEKVDFIFDEQKEADKFLRDWGEYIRLRPKAVVTRYGDRPKPLDEKEYMPLQAADLWAWWVRKWHVEGRAHEAMNHPNFGPFEEERRGFHKLHIAFSEDQITTELMKIVADEIRPSQTVFDLGCADGVRGIYGRKLD